MTDTLKTVRTLVDDIAREAFDEGVAHGKGAKNFCGSNGKVPALIDALIAQMQRDAVQPGWKLVPVEPPDEMQAPSYMGPDGPNWPIRKEIYRAMLAAAPHPEAQALRHATKENGDCPQWCKACKVEAESRAQQQDDHAGSPAPSEPVATLHDDGHYTFKPGQEPWGARQAGWRMDVYAAQSSKAALSDEDARLSEDDLHARSWWCPTCKKDVPPEMVTKDGTHYLEAGGCGYAVRGELIEDQPKQPLSDEEIHRIWMETPERPTLAEEVLAFGHTLLARAGITPQAGKESGDV